MSKEQYIDEHGIVWISASRVAERMNEIALEKYGIEANYTRWSVYQRRDELPYLDTPLGRLFREDAVADLQLRPRAVKREDTTKRNKQRAKKNENEPGGANSPSVIE